MLVLNNICKLEIHMKNKYFLLIYPFLLFIMLNCDNTNPINYNRSITLKPNGVSCTEEWINLTSTNLHLPAIVTLKQNDTIRKSFNLNNSDKLLYVDPPQQYSTYIIHTTTRSYVNSSNELNVITIDTTLFYYKYKFWQE